MSLAPAVNFAVLKNIEWRKYFHRNYLYLTGIVCGIAVGSDLPGLRLAVLLLLFLTILLLFSKLYREILMLVLATAAGLLAVGYQKYSSSTLHNSRLENAVVKVSDSGAVGQKLSPDEQSVKRIIVNCGGKRLQLYLSNQLQHTAITDGNTYRVTGNVYTVNTLPEYFAADQHGHWHDVSLRFRRSNYHDYLAINGIVGILYLEKIEPLPSSQPSRLALIRRKLAQRLDRNINDPVNRAIIGAVTLGLRYRLTGSEKQNYASVGLAHLFSVSGLHVGVLAAIILLLMRPLPKWLQIPASGTLICYVLLTGSNAPAIRAFAMVLILVYFRAYFLRCRPLEVLSAICGIFLLANPLYLTDGGFLYSFVITAVLIKSTEFGQDIVRTFSGPEYLIGTLPRSKQLFCRWRGKLSGAIFFAASASAASSALTLFFQNMFFAGSMIVNLLILPILLPLYLLSLSKLILPQWADLWNVPLNFLVDYLELTAKIGNEFAGNSEIMQLSYLTVLIFTVLLLLFFIFARKKFGLAVLALLLAIIGFMHLRSSFAPSTVHAVIWGGCIEKPVAAIIRPQAHTMYLLNCNYDSVTPLLDIAAFYGISQIDRLDIGNPVAGCVNGLPYLSNKMPIHKYRKSQLPVRSKLFREYAQNLKIHTGAEINSLSMNILTGTPDIKFETAPDGTLTLYSSGKKYTLERTRYPRAYIIEQN